MQYCVKIVTVYVYHRRILAAPGVYVAFIGVAKFIHCTLFLNLYCTIHECMLGHNYY